MVPTAMQEQFQLPGYAVSIEVFLRIVEEQYIRTLYHFNQFVCHASQGLTSNVYIVSNTHARSHVLESVAGELEVRATTNTQFWAGYKLVRHTQMSTSDAGS